jgi:hypothetical protein
VPLIPFRSFLQFGGFLKARTSPPLYNSFNTTKTTHKVVVAVVVVAVQVAIGADRTKPPRTQCSIRWVRTEFKQYRHNNTSIESFWLLCIHVIWFKLTLIHQAPPCSDPLLALSLSLNNPTAYVNNITLYNLRFFFLVSSVCFTLRCPPLSGRPCIRKARPVNSTLNYFLSCCPLYSLW